MSKRKKSNKCEDGNHAMFEIPEAVSQRPKEKLDFESMRAITRKMKLYPGSFVEDMRAAG
ncbi:MAG: hypothetical protein CFE49_12855 [Pseudomonas sp. PGPPP3]|nr:MAG: hypothetical protein CFE49_12855 [Pseudomonas sp. PGPPP3]